MLREADFKVTAVIVDEELIEVEPGDTTDRRYAIAFDLGTTTVVATLLDLVTGTPVAVASMLNKQQPFGGDVISRISATMLDPDALGRLQTAACQTLAELAAQVCDEGGVDPLHVYEVAIAGNATMTALVLGIDPEPLGVAPFIMTTALPPTVLAEEMSLGLHPRARAVMFPALGAYVGGDIVAGMLASGMDRDKRTRLFIDVGTNCEIVLSDGDRILSTAAPAGPAFEGGAIRCGMRAADGAIEVIKMGTDVELGVIGGDVEPKGLCGSGLVDAVAELVKVGLLDKTGRFVPDEVAKELAPDLADRLTMIGKERVFVLYRPAPDSDPAECVVLTQRDVRELQFAKAAISTGWTLLLEELGLEHDDVQQVLLAGSFGSYLSAASAVRIGLVPKLPVLRIVAAGNVAGEGAKMALLSVRERAGAQALLEEVAYVELSDRPEFNDRFVEQLAFQADASTVALIACGAIAQPCQEIVARRGWAVAVHPLPPLLHNSPHLIADEVRAPGHVAGAHARDGRGGVRRLRDVRRARRGLPRPRAEHAAGAALLRPVRGLLTTGRVPRRPAGDLPVHRLPGEELRPHGGARARAGPLPRAGRGLLPPLHAGGVAGPGADAGAARQGRARGRAHGPAAHRRGDR